jgi:transposase-like protein
MMIKIKRFRGNEEPFKWKHFEGEVILWLVRGYGGYALSYKDLQEMAAERGLSVNCSTIYRWVQQYGPELENRIKINFKKDV